MSRFGWLWWHAASSARENFTTQALALAIESDWTPLRHLPHLADQLEGEVTSVEVFTQTSVGQSTAQGHLDMVLEIRTPHGTRVAWLEIKVHAPVSGEQIETYFGAMEALPEAGRPVLLQVGGWSKIHPKVDWIKWQSVRDAARRSSDSTWQDFGAYLDEAQITTDAADPIQPAELAAAEVVSAFLRKTTRMVEEAIESGADWGLSDWHESPKAKSQISNSLRDSGQPRAVLWSPHWFLSLSLGFSRADTKLRAAVRFGADPRWRELRKVVLARAAAAGLTGTWETSTTARWALTAWAPQGAVESGSITEWYAERLSELGKANLLVDLDGYGNEAASSDDPVQPPPEPATTPSTEFEQ